MFSDGVYNPGVNTLNIEGRYLNRMANGAYYIIISAKNFEWEEVRSKPEVLVILS